MGVVVDRRELDELPEFRLGGLPASDSEVRDSERLADRLLLRLPPLCLLERHGRLRGHAALEMGATLLKEAVGGLAHGPRYGKFSSIKSTGCVKSRVFPISIPAISRPLSTARSTASASSKGGPESPSSRGTSSGPKAHNGAPPSGFAGSSSITFVT